MNQQQRDEIRQHAESLTMIIIDEAVAQLERLERERLEHRERSKWRRYARTLHLGRILKRKR